MADVQFGGRQVDDGVNYACDCKWVNSGLQWALVSLVQVGGCSCCADFLLQSVEYSLMIGWSVDELQVPCVVAIVVIFDSGEWWPLSNWIIRHSPELLLSHALSLARYIYIPTSITTATIVMIVVAITTGVAIMYIIDSEYSGVSYSIGHMIHFVYRLAPFVFWWGHTAARVAGFALNNSRRSVGATVSAW